jgi:hypothetical protein
VLLALLLARQGIPTTLLEAHTDFKRDFRGDTVHPAILDILDDIGLATRLLETIPTPKCGVSCPSSPAECPSLWTSPHWAADSLS